MSNNLFASGERHPVVLHAEPSDFVWEGNKQQSGGAPGNQSVNFDQIKLRMQHGADGILRPAGIKQLKTSAVAKLEIKTDVDGESRDETVIAGCDDPRTEKRQFASPADTGPDWWRSKNN